MILILNYSEQCNSRCTTCSIWRNRSPRVLPMPVIRRVLAARKVRQAGNIYLTGGEPYLTDQCVEIARAVVEAGIPASISGATNALEPEAYTRRLAMMRDAGTVVTPSVSLNGDKETHDRTRGVPGNYDLALRMMELLAAGGFAWNVAFLRGPETEEARDHVYEVAARFGVGVVETVQRQSRRYGNYAPRPGLYRFNCPAPYGLFAVWPDGSVTACEEDDPRLTIGNIYEEDLDEMDFDGVGEYVRSGGCQPCTMSCYYDQRLP